jgi:glycosyltransferase involved in cell wall biosynthesis
LFTDYNSIHFPVGGLIEIRKFLLNERYNLRMLSICVVTQQLGKIVSGPGLHASNLVRSLAADGQSVTVVAPEDQRPPGELSYNFVPIPGNLFSGNHARWFPISWHAGRTLHRLERTMNFDIIHFTDAREVLFCSSKLPLVGNMNDTYAAEKEGLGYYISHYQEGLMRWLYYSFIHGCEQWGLPRLKAVIANSDYTARVITKRYRLMPERVHVCYKSVELSKYILALEKRVCQKSHKPRVLFLGGNYQRKGVPYLIRAAPMVLQRVPGCEFWIAGRDDAEPAMRALCRQLGVEDSFQFLGWKSQDELVDLYAQADVFAMPSLIEAFGMVFLEAMAAGVPVIGTRVGGVPEMITDGKNGRLVSPQDSVELAAALVEVLLNPALQEKFRTAGLETARSFSVERMMEHTYRIYGQVLGRNI